MRSIVQVLFIVVIVSIFVTFAQQKFRLPKSINSSSLNLLPVISPDGDELYFDRKWHPLNTGGLSDDDDIWIAKKIESNNWIVLNEKPKLGTLKNDFLSFEEINQKGSNALFYIFPCGTKALLYGNFGPDENPTFAITKKTKGKWNKPIPLKIENFYNRSNSYSGTISSDGRIILMSIQRDDSQGDLDIYISMLNDSTGEYSEPKNLGEKINTKGIDFVSFLAYDHRTLYFSSTGRGGKGKFDLFMTRRLDDTWLNWSDPISLDSIINSKWDENSISLSIAGDTAYFVSGDDSSGMGGIYFAELPEQYRPLPYLILQGLIFVENSSSVDTIDKPVWFNISNFNSDYVFFDTVYDGRYRIVVPYNTQYNIIVGAEGYKERSFSSSAYGLLKTTTTQYNITLRPKQQRKSLLAIVYFETDVDTLNQKAREELNNIGDFLLESSYSKIEIVGHTDEIGTEEYNNQLSLRRARSVANYLVKNFGINPNMIKTIGKGKSEPVSIELNKNRRAVIFLLEDD